MRHGEDSSDCCTGIKRPTSGCPSGRSSAMCNEGCAHECSRDVLSVSSRSKRRTNSDSWQPRSRRATAARYHTGRDRGSGVSTASSATSSRSRTPSNTTSAARCRAAPQRRSRARRHRVRADHCPVTSRIRTLIDLGAVARPWLVSRALEHVAFARAHHRSSGSRHALDGRRTPGPVRSGSLAEGARRPSASVRGKRLRRPRSCWPHGAPRRTAGPSRCFTQLITRTAATPSKSISLYPGARCSSSKCDGYGPHTRARSLRGGSSAARTCSSTPATWSRRYSAARVMRRSHVVAAGDRGGPQRASHPAELSREDRQVCRLTRLRTRSGVRVAGGGEDAVAGGEVLVDR